VTQDEAIAPVRRLAVPALDDLAIGPADTQPQYLDQQLAGTRLRLGELGELRPVGLAWNDGDRPHEVDVPTPAPLTIERWTSAPRAHT
jgi:hypothetical protein